MSASERGLAHHIKAEYVIYVPQQQPEQPFIKDVRKMLRHCVPLLPFPHLALIYSTESTQPPLATNAAFVPKPTSLKVLTFSMDGLRKTEGDGGFCAVGLCSMSSSDASAEGREGAGHGRGDESKVVSRSVYDKG